MKPTGYYRYERPEMLPFVPARRARALEIGCGEGRFIGGLTGVEESWGIEPTPAAEVAKSHLTRVIQATFDEAEPHLPTGYFDLVICNDVIEHMSDHESFFSRIGQYIAPGGMMIGSIPNVRFYANIFQFLLEKDWYYTDAGTLDRTHLAFFTEKSRRRTLEAHGFRILRLEGINEWSPCSSGSAARTRVYRWLGRAVLVATFGYFADIRYLQFAFQATPHHEPGAP